MDREHGGGGCGVLAQAQRDAEGLLHVPTDGEGRDAEKEGRMLVQGQLCGVGADVPLHIGEYGGGQIRRQEPARDKESAELL